MGASRRTSITRTITALFAAISVALFAAMGAYLDRSLRDQLVQRDSEEIVGKVELIRHHLVQLADADAVINESHRIRDALVGHENLHLTLRARDGRVLYAKSALQIPEEAFGQPAALGERPSTIRSWTSLDGKPYRIASAKGALADTRALWVRIDIALDISEHAALLSAYRLRLAVAVLVASLLAMLLGWFTARHGLVALKRIVRAAAEISAERLGERLDAATAPVELADLVHAFNGMLERLEASFRQLEDFSSDLAHEFRTPMHNLMLQTQVALSRTRSTDEYERLLASNYEEYERLSRMISEMLFLAKADSRQLVLDRSRVDLRHEAALAVEFFEAMLEDAGLNVSLEGGAAVMADPLLVRRAISNLLSNAVRHTPRGGTIRIAISTPEPGGAQIEVANPGAGIPAAHLGRVFDRFYRVDPARGESQGSSGLGLAIVRAIMRLHGGEATAASEPGGLTRFRLRFPADDARADTTAEATAGKIPRSPSTPPSHSCGPGLR